MRKLLAGIAAVLTCSAAIAQYPNRPIKLISLDDGYVKLKAAANAEALIHRHLGV